MADDLKNKTISKSNSGFPDYLDFDKLRSSAIEYIGNLSGKIWTDYNVHDPGITILEVLIYALLDLGYRTNLPVADLFSRNPDDKSIDNNFFSPSRILTNNPLTITDFRKLLVDLEGVKNAWLEVDQQSPVDFCKEEDFVQPPVGTMIIPNSGSERDPCKCEFLNGLYHVFVQLEDGIEENKHNYEKIIRKIKQALMAHRNLCEDFVDIKILCKLEIGLCAEIELEPDADVEEVYLKIVEVLREFFSPSPKFYSLQQLLEKQRPIEEIFAGRPFNTTESHGFIDTEEFEQLKLKKQIHLSDVYHVLSDIKGVRNVRNLGWIKCCEKKISVDGWILKLPENFIPEFSTKCSGFTFNRNGVPVMADLNKFESLFNLKFSGQQKALYSEPSPYLDPEFPKGIYHSDLANYYFIQNEFPHVYGIREGDLASDAPDKRKAQVLQLQGFLLFFDQLLANYLTQLKNIRSLFALSSSKNEEENHTYFTNQLINAPQLQKLLRFKINGETDTTLGAEGSILAYPTDRKKIQDLIDLDKLKNTDLERKCDDAKEKDFPEYKFCFAAERDQAINQLKDDLLLGEYEPVIVSNINDCYFFYIFTSSPDFVLISKRYYKDKKEAVNAAASIKYVATFPENYRYFSATCCENETEYFSFDIDLNLDAYAKYLQLIVEDKELYATRRQDFLNHLLSRFAERFTDYALLSSPFLSEDELQTKQIRAEENFLSQYDDLSSNRGKAYDYLKNRWGNNNISGFEKRFKALTGVENWKRHYLCNFVVEKADKQYYLSISFFNHVFEVENKIVNEEDLLASVQSIYKKLTNPLFDLKYIEHEKQWQIYIEDEFGNKYGSKQLFQDEEKADAFRNTLTSVFRFNPDISKDVFISKYIHKVLFVDHSETIVAESKEHFSEKNPAEEFSRKAGKKLSSFLNDSKKFKKHGLKIKFDKLLVVSEDKLPFISIDENKFIFKDTDVINLKEEKKKFSALNKIETIQFDSLKKYDDTKLAKRGFRDLLILLPFSSNYSIEENKQTQAFEIFVSYKDEKVAIYFASFNTFESAQEKVNEIVTEVNTYTYKLYITEPIPDEWEFKYRSEDLSGNVIDYISEKNYKNKKDASQGSIDFYSNIPLAKVKVADNKLQLVLDKKDIKIKCRAIIEKPGIDEANKAEQILKSSQELFNKINNQSNELKEILVSKRVNPGEEYIYKLVDKDNLRAHYPAKIENDQEAKKIKNDLINRASSGYNYIDIVLGSDVVYERKDAKTKIKWFHYLVKCSNRKYKKGNMTGKDLVLFESTKGYITKEEAIAAFNENYLLILKYGRLEKNYGPCKLISLEEILIHIDDPTYNSDSIVFVPKKTSDEFGGYEIPKELIPLVSSYPIRYERKNKYRFVVGRIDAITKTFQMDWRSKKSYSTGKETAKQLQFFLILLKYPGNFYVEKSQTDCNFHIYIREVLAISAHGFQTPEKAWGKDGIEKFICVSQSEMGFHNYFNRLNCSYSFYVACGNTGLIHPCIYETPRRRDSVMDKLYNASNFNFLELISSMDARHIILNDLEGNSLVSINIEKKCDLDLNPCEWLFKFFETVNQDNNYVKLNEGLHLNYKFIKGKQDTSCTIGESLPVGIKLNDWKRKLKEIACYFPVTEKEITCNSVISKKYFVEIKLPGFGCNDDDCLDETVTTSPCEGPGCKVSCHVAWKSDCCFDSCCDAINFYIQSLLLLEKYENYKPVYDCNCGSYRVELVPQLSLKGKKDFIKNMQKKINILCKVNEYYSQENTTIRKPTNNDIPCFSEIVAINSQAYNSEKMACDAVERSKKLINSEGLHLVEHILLRPRCKDEDCECKGLPEPCVDDKMCHFQWKPGGDIDPCEKDKIICLTPGCDSYSFIATVALPAWPERFRSDSGRKIIEKLLQRQAPAHVLLRILWLNPHDFCCFEYYFKHWTEWLAKKICNTDYSTCEFLIFLFKKHFDTLCECEECQPCSCGNKKPVSCFSESVDPCSNFSLFDKLNQLFCWSDSKSKYYNPCEDGPGLNVAGDKISEPYTNMISSLELDEVSKDLVKIIEEQDVISEEQKNNLMKEKFKLVQSRSFLYEENIKKINAENPKSKTAVIALAFLKKSKPVPEQFKTLIEEIIRDKTDKTKKIEGLTKNQKRIILQNITLKYLDLVCFTGNEIEKITVLSDVFMVLGKKHLNMNELFEIWDSKKIKQFESRLDFEKIKNCLVVN